MPVVLIKNKKTTIAFIFCTGIFIFTALVCLSHIDSLQRPLFQQKTAIISAASAKYEMDGNIYIIDSGASRLLCMTPSGKIKYKIQIDKLSGYAKLYNSTIDGNGNLYLHVSELQTDALLTKQDIIKQYDSKGNFIKDIFVLSYEDSDADDRPHTFIQFGSLRCEKDTITFSRVQRNSVTLYIYDTIQNEVSSTKFSYQVHDFSVARLTLRDFSNFIYTTRGGDVYEVKDGANPVRRASFDFTETERGIIPWYLDYDVDGTIVFLDMASALLYRITDDNRIEKEIPQEFFDSLIDQSAFPFFARFGFWDNHFAGVYGDLVWYYDGSEFKTYPGSVLLPQNTRIEIAVVQICSVIGVVAFFIGLYLLIVRILDRYVSLFIKQTVFVIPITIAAFAILHTVSFDLLTVRLDDAIFDEMLVMTTLSSKFIDGDAVDNLKSIKDFDSDTYRNLAKTLKTIVHNNSDDWNKLFYAAVYKVVGSMEYFLAISNDEANMFRPYSLITDETSGEYKLISHGTPFADFVDYIDGAWAYSNVPIYNRAGKIVGIFEVGLDMTSYQTSNLLQRQKMATIAAGICLVILFALAAILATVIKHLTQHAHVLNKITNGDYNERVVYHAKDELGDVSRRLNFMASQLQFQFSQISSLNKASLRFVPLPFMQQLGVTDITDMRLGDFIQRDFAVLVFDIRAFSVSSEMMSARENFLFINDVLSVSGPIIRHHNGFVDKYLGDAVQALFANANDAVQAGIEIYKKVILDKDTQIRIGSDGINIGVGIHFGAVMMGIVGEPERLSNTIISESVTIATQLESFTKKTASSVLISGNTFKQLSAKNSSEDKLKYRFLGTVLVPGITKPMDIYDILDALPEGVCEKRLQTSETFAAGIQQFFSKNYEAALKSFKSVVEMDPTDKYAAHCRTEAEKHIQNPKLPVIFDCSGK